MKTGKGKYNKFTLNPIACFGMLLVLTVYCLLITDNCFSKGSGSSSASFLKLGIGGRGVAMGDAHTAAVDDVMSVYWNPACLSILNQNEIGFMHNSYFQGIDQDVFYYAHPTEKKGTFAGGLSLTRVGGIAGYDSSGVQTGSLSASDILLTGGWGKSWELMPLLPGVHTGMNLKILQKKLAGDSAMAYMLDLGMMYEAKDGFFRHLRTGFLIQNLGTGLSFISEKSSLPMNMKLGFAYPFFGDNITAALDFVMPSDDSMYFNLGMDYRLWDILAFRIGFKGQRDLDTGLTYGMRFGNERLHLDYAFAPFGVLGDSHRVSIGLKFGKVYRQSQVHSQIRRAYQRAEVRYAQGYLVDAYIQAQQIMDVAPWHYPSKTLLRRVEREFKNLEELARKEQLKEQIDDHYLRGEQHFQVDDMLAARREFEAILALQPDHMGAKTYLKRIDDRFKSIVNGFYETGMRYFAAGDYGKAIEYFEKVLVVETDHAEARAQLSRAEILLSQQKEAANKRAVVEAVRPLYKVALGLFKQKQYEEALRKFNEILALDLQNSEAKRYRLLCRELVAKEYYEKGNKAARNGKMEEAFKWLTKSIEYDPNYQPARKQLDIVNRNRRTRYKEESQKYYKLGLEAFLSGDPDKALDFWKKSLELDPDNMEAKRGVERIMQRRKR